jgi:phosphohistidine phosphatase
MRRLLLLRHAKSSWADAGLRDHERPLNARGREAAPRVGRYLDREGLVPDLVLCSSARRTCETVARLRLPEKVPVEVSHDLYLGSPDAVLDLVRQVDDTVATLLVVGHNPTTHELALTLAGAGDADLVDDLARRFPTGALAGLAFDGDWRSLDAGAARLERFVAPRDLD